MIHAIIIVGGTHTCVYVYRAADYKFEGSKVEMEEDAIRPEKQEQRACIYIHTYMNVMQDSVLVIRSAIP